MKARDYEVKSLYRCKREQANFPIRIDTASMQFAIVISVLADHPAL